jgi:hypothetical protein
LAPELDALETEPLGFCVSVGLLLLGFGFFVSSCFFFMLLLFELAKLLFHSLFLDLGGQLLNPIAPGACRREFGRG